MYYRIETTGDPNGDAIRYVDDPSIVFEDIQSHLFDSQYPKSKSIRMTIEIEILPNDEAQKKWGQDSDAEFKLQKYVYPDQW